MTVLRFGTGMQSSTYVIHDPTDCTITRIPESFVLREPLKVGTKLAPIYVRKTGPNPDVKVGGNLAMQPGLPQRVVLGEWLEVTDVLISGLLKSAYTEGAIPATAIGDSLASRASERSAHPDNERHSAKPS
jgi:hypothetical protein